ASIFYSVAQAVNLIESSELVEFGNFPADSVVIVISRSGRSVEIVRLAEKAKHAGAQGIGITNAPEGTLATKADFPSWVPIALDHAISVNTYSTLAAAAGVLAKAVTSGFAAADAAELSRAIDEAGRAVPEWQRQIAASKWFMPGRTTYFLGRGPSLGTAQ